MNDQSRQEETNVGLSPSRQEQLKALAICYRCKEHPLAMCGVCLMNLELVGRGFDLGVSSERERLNEDRLFAANAILELLRSGYCPYGYDRDDLRAFSERLLRERAAPPSAVPAPEER